MKYQASLLDAIEQLGGEKDSLFTTLLDDGKMKVEYYTPVKEDYKAPMPRMYCI